MISSIPQLVPTDVESWDSIDQRVQIQFSQNVVWEFLWDNEENRVLAYKDTDVVYEIRSDSEITVKAAMRAVGYHPGAHLVYVDHYEQYVPIEENLPILDVPIQTEFLLQMTLRINGMN